MKTLPKSLFYILLPIALLCSAAGANANLVTNGGFETGDFTGWTQGGDHSATFVFVNPHSGVYAAWLGPGSSNGTLSQALATTAGASYTLSFWLALDPGVFNSNSFSASFDGMTVAGSSFTNSGSFGYTLFTFTGLQATSSSTVLEFTFFNPTGFWFLDDVSVDAASAVPDTGSSALLLSLGLVGLCLAQRTLHAQRILLVRR